MSDERENVRAYTATVDFGPETPLQRTRREAQETLKRYRTEGRKPADFRAHAIAVHYAALEQRARRIVNQLMVEHQAGRLTRDGHAVAVHAVAEQDIADTAEMFHAVWERGVEDGRERLRTALESQEKQMAEEQRTARESLRNLRRLARKGAFKDGTKKQRARIRGKKR